MRKLDIIVTHYRLPFDAGKQLFDTIAVQRGINFADIRVIVVNDGYESILPAEAFDAYPYRVEQHTIPHSGVSAARNKGLCVADAEWVLICDFDDGFYNVYALEKFFEQMRGGINVIIGKFYQECLRDGKFVLKEFTWRDGIFVHAKMFRRQWLEDNQLHFNDQLTLHEDSYFITLCLFTAGEGEVAMIEDPVYIWQYNPSSASRLGGDFTLRTFDHWVRKEDALIQELVSRNLFNCVKIVVMDAVAETYCNLFRQSWLLPSEAMYYCDAKKWWRWFARRYREVINVLDPEKLADRIRKQTDFFMKFEPIDPARPAFSEWIQEYIREDKGEKENGQS